MGTEAVTDKDRSREALGAARELGYQADDRKSLGQALDKLAPLSIRIIAPAQPQAELALGATLDFIVQQQGVAGRITPGR